MGITSVNTQSSDISWHPNYTATFLAAVSIAPINPDKKSANVNLIITPSAMEIRLYESAKKYLDVVLNGSKKIPVKAWQSEQTALTAERFSLCEEYCRLKDETRSVKLLRKGAENIMRQEQCEQTVTKKWEVEL